MSEDAPYYGAMNEHRAREILGSAVGSDNSLADNGRAWLGWRPGDSNIRLDGEFSIELLEAIAWWLRNKTPG